MQKQVLLVATLLCATTPLAHAACVNSDALVLDTTKVANRSIDVAKVTVAARGLAGQGATVRVRVYDTLHGSTNIDALADKDIRECKWTQPGGDRLSNLYYIAFAVERGDIKIATGKAVNARINEAATTKAIVTYMVPRWQSYKKDPNALTAGLVDILESSKVVLAQPLTGGGNTTIVRHEASDTSWLKYLAIGVITIGGGLAVAFFLLRKRQEKDESQGVSAETYRIRADCRNRLLALNDDTVVIEAKAAKAAGSHTTGGLESDLATYKRLVAAGMSEFRRFDDPNRDPDEGPSVPVNVLLSNQQRYADIIVQHIEPAEKLKAIIETMFDGETSHETQIPKERSLGRVTA